MVRTRPLAGGVLIAVAAGLKPYAAAWFGAAVGLGGLPALLALAIASAVVWSPQLVWGVGGFVTSLTRVAASPVTPLWRYLLAGAFTVAGLVMHRWRWALLVGAAAFRVALFAPQYFHLGYLVPLVTVAGLAFEAQSAGASASESAGRRVR